MKKQLYFFLITTILSTLELQAQKIFPGFQYQAVLRDPFNVPVANVPVSLRVSLLTDNQGSKVLFTEQHLTQTNEHGLLAVVIGEGTQRSNPLSDIPWEQEQLWLKVEVARDDNVSFVVLSNNRLMSVPYAMHAASAREIAPAKEGEPSEKNQSIYWTTGGNTGTRPPTHFIGTRDATDLAIKTNNTTYALLTKEGQLQYQSGADGPDTEMSSYPWVVQGSNQGIWIKVNGSRSYDNNFLTFADDIGTWGAVEGQTVAEMEDYWQYKLNVAVYALTGVSLAGQIVAWTAEGVSLIASGLGAGAGAGALLNAAVLIVNSAALITNSITWSTEMHKQVGVSYSSGAGDYAEWLERVEGERDLHFGEIVGVKAGKVSLNTSAADHYRVVSKKPIVLGNTPGSGNEQKFEKIAFMGQVKVRIAGVASVGDYIIPSTNNDGYGIAVNPKNMKIGDYSRIVGVAWESAPDVPFSLINVAIGINSNDMANKVELLEQKVKNIKGYLKGQNTLTAGQADFGSAASLKLQTTQQKLISNEAFDKMLDQNKALYMDMYAKVKLNLEAKGYDINANPLLVKFFENPVEAIKQIRRDPQFATQWALVDQKLKSGK